MYFFFFPFFMGKINIREGCVERQGRTWTGRRPVSRWKHFVSVVSLDWSALRDGRDHDAGAGWSLLWFSNLCLARWFRESSHWSGMLWLICNFNFSRLNPGKFWFFFSLWYLFNHPFRATYRCILYIYRYIIT